jgi:hypothetical protein
MKQNNTSILPIRTHVVPDRAPISQLPIPLTSFIGREQEVRTVCNLLQESTVRLLTKWG